MDSALQPGSVPKPQPSLFPLVFAQESPRFSTFVFNRFRTLPSSVGCKSFACHSYENCRVCTNSSQFGTQLLVLTPIWSSCDEKRVTASPLESVFTICDSCKSFRVRFYENCRVSLGVASAFVKKNFNYAGISTGRNNWPRRFCRESWRAHWTWALAAGHFCFNLRTRIRQTRPAEFSARAFAPLREHALAPWQL